MNIEHAKLAVDVLQGVVRDKKHVKMFRWKNECGTSSCAWGWIASDVRVKATGVYWISRIPMFLGMEGFDGAEAWLDIEDFNATYLFSALKYEHTDHRAIPEVIDRIEELMAEARADDAALASTPD